MGPVMAVIPSKGENSSCPISFATFLFPAGPSSPSCLERRRSRSLFRMIVPAMPHGGNRPVPSAGRSVDVPPRVANSGRGLPAGWKGPLDGKALLQRPRCPGTIPYNGGDARRREDMLPKGATNAGRRRRGDREEKIFLLAPPGKRRWLFSRTSAALPNGRRDSTPASRSATSDPGGAG